MDTQSLQPAPRLQRLTRHSPPFRTDQLSTPIAGPSRAYPDTINYGTSEDDEDAEATPRMNAAMGLESPTAAETLTGDTPASRLRALLARNAPSTPQSTSRMPDPQTPSEMDSDFDNPYSDFATPSYAHESVRDLFHHAMRDPGSTPRRHRRENTNFESDIEYSSGTEHPASDHYEGRGQKGEVLMSMSEGEEEERMSVDDNARQSVDSVPATSSVATYDALRERVSRSRSVFPDVPDESQVMDISMPPTDTTGHTTTVIRESGLLQPGFSRQVPETPMRSLHMSELQSNLLDGDSEMQKALRAMDSDDNEPTPNGRRISFPPVRPKPPQIPHSRPPTWSSHHRSHSAHGLPPPTRPSEDLSLSRTSLTGADSELHERERRWNHPQPKSPANAMNGYASQASPSRALSRHNSDASIQSMDTDRSARSGSVASPSDYRDNKSASKAPRITSSLTLPERTRTTSQPPRPDSAESYLSPQSRKVMSREPSKISTSSSRASSIINQDVEPEPYAERMADSPRSKAVRQGSQEQLSSLSPNPSSLPPTSLPVPSQRIAQRASASPNGMQYADFRQRGDNVLTQDAASPRGDASYSPAGKGKQPVRSLIPSLASGRILEDASNSLASPQYVSSPQAMTEPSEETPTAYRSRYGWTFPQRAPSTSSEIDTEYAEEQRPTQTAIRPAAAVNSTAGMYAEERRSSPSVARPSTTARTSADVYAEEPRPPPAVTRPSIAVRTADMYSEEQRQAQPFERPPVAVNGTAEMYSEEQRPPATAVRSSVAVRTTSGASAIPVRSPASTPERAERRRGPKRNLPEPAIPVVSDTPSAGETTGEDMIMESIGTDDHVFSASGNESPTAMSTPTVRPTSLSPPNLRRASPPLSNTSLAQGNITMQLSEIAPSRPDSPPPAPPEPGQQQPPAFSNSPRRSPPRVPREQRPQPGDDGPRMRRSPPDEHELRARRPPRTDYEPKARRSPPADYEPQEPRSTSAAPGYQRPLPDEYEPRVRRSPLNDQELRVRRSPLNDHEPRVRRSPPSEYEHLSRRSPLNDAEPRSRRSPLIDQEPRVRRMPLNDYEASSRRLPLNDYEAPSRRSPPHESELRVQRSPPDGARHRTPQDGARQRSPPLAANVQQPPIFSAAPRHPLPNGNKAEYRSPSPPQDVPDLPEPPSFRSEEDNTDVQYRTPDNSGGAGIVTLMKTPRPPGAWLQTPEARHIMQDLTPRAHSSPPEVDVSNDNVPSTPVSTWPRGGPMVAQTPAFPGAWQPTPVPSARKKSILKVRFDVESEATASDVNHERMPDESSRLPIASGWKADRLPALNPDAHGSLALFEEESTVERTPVPARARRKGPSVRVVDAFGRETLEEEDVKPDVDSLLAGPVPAGSRNRSKVKIVDALGREVKDEGNGAEAPLSHKEALDRVRRGIADMAEDLDDMDRSFEAMAVDDKRINALEDASRGAREARQKIVQSLKFVQEAENDEFWPPKEKIHNGGLLPAAIADTRLRWNSWLFWCFIIVQLVLLAVLYRMSYVRAKRIFLTTYYDPFYADLYLYPFHADTLDHAIPAPSWSIYSVPDTFARSGWLGVLGELWGNATCAVSHWQRQTIEVWRPNLQGEASSSWPPQ